MNISEVNSPAAQMGRLYNDRTSDEGVQAALRTAVQKNDAMGLRKACEGFESYFLQSMFRQMRETSLNTGGIFAKSGAEEIFEDMLYEEYSKIAASRGGIGLADMMYRHVRANAQLNISSREAEGLGPVKPGNQQIAMVPNPAASAGR